MTMTKIPREIANKIYVVMFHYESYDTFMDIVSNATRVSHEIWSLLTSLQLLNCGANYDTFERLHYFMNKTGAGNITLENLKKLIQEIVDVLGENPKTDSIYLYNKSHVLRCRTDETDREWFFATVEPNFLEITEEAERAINRQLKEQNSPFRLMPPKPKLEYEARY